MTTFDDPGYVALFADAEAVREHRAAFLGEIKSGAVPLATIFERAAIDPVLASMKVLPAIEALPDAGKVQTRRAFEELDISEGGLIGDVSADDVAALPAAIERHAL